MNGISLNTIPAYKASIYFVGVVKKFFSRRKDVVKDLAIRELRGSSVKNYVTIEGLVCKYIQDAVWDSKLYIEFRLRSLDAAQGVFLFTVLYSVDGLDGLSFEVTESRRQIIEHNKRVVVTGSFFSIPFVNEFGEQKRGTAILASDVQRAGEV